MGADIALSHGAEQGVNQRVQHRIGIRMTEESTSMRNLDTAQYQFSAAAKPMHVKAMTDAKFFCHRQYLVGIITRSPSTINQPRP
jgi:hypothetical protein